MYFISANRERERNFWRWVEREGVRTGSLAEEGNLAYRYYRSVADEDELFLYEEWKDVDAHGVHRTMPHYQRLQECQGEFLESTAVNKYITE